MCIVKKKIKWIVLQGVQKTTYVICDRCITRACSNAYSEREGRLTKGTNLLVYHRIMVCKKWGMCCFLQTFPTLYLKLIFKTYEIH